MSLNDLALANTKPARECAARSLLKFLEEESFPQHRAGIDKILLKKGQVLEQYYLYSTAYTSADYQDAALLCLLWFRFWRASDLTMLHKANLSIGAGDIFFVRFIRVKTAKDQGLSLFPDDDFSTCLLLANALALVTQFSPTASLLSKFSEPQTVSRASLTSATPLIDLIDHTEAVIPLHQNGQEVR
uniref:Uncharacterized protein n=1 Tax=Phytophthora ramorum TaxID=164328 RepID=H3GS36_PHYRM